MAFTALAAIITTTVFPDPQQSYTVNSIVDVVGTKNFKFIGGSLGYRHIYNVAQHFFIRQHLVVSQIIMLVFIQQLTLVMTDQMAH